MITLKNVSKFYYNKGIIASGFSRVNLTFNMGEFVAITGESGSGKSTLLNVISGLDSYEEGEMYIDGKYSKERADAKQKQIFNDLQYYKRTLDDSRNKVMELTNELNNTSPNVHTMRDKVLYVVDKIIITRLSRFVCELTIINKWTGEQRIFEYNTRTCTILKMRTKTRPTLQPPK